MSIPFGVSGVGGVIERVNVALGQRSYEILVGEGLLGEAGRLIRPFLKERRAFVVTDERVADLHLLGLSRALETEGVAARPVVLPPGEGSKDFAHLERLVETLLDEQIERGSLILALGGGVIGDLAGFVASILLRGVDLVQLPTTLLAQVDSAVGGKTGINTRHGKNLVGSFHQPRLVLADIDALSTLPRREFLAGYSEVVKYGLINDPGFFTWLEGHASAIRDGARAARRRAVASSCAAKAAIVARDERETGERALLNLGHTFGHALEAECGYSAEMLHGEAVAVGMCLAFDLSVRLGLCPMEDADRVRRHLAVVGLPTGFEAFAQRIWDPDRLIGHMRQDKKVVGGKITFILVRGIGQAFLHREVDIEEVRKLLAEAIAEGL
ncbi:MAG TPA: 3-dehydroquinate synthase [Alphaproteobacteria bacterium]|nr:3-dehydroquinate synthase [Alphaproteobacteria bacterium]